MATNEGLVTNRVRVSRPRRRWRGVSRVAAMVDACVYLALLVVFNLYPHKVGFWVSAADPASFVPLLTPGFSIHMPYLNALWALGLVVALAKVVYGRWTPVLRLADLGVGTLTIYVLVRLITGGTLISSTIADGAARAWDFFPFQGAQAASPDLAFKGLLGIVALMISLKIVQGLLATVRTRQWEPAG